MEQRIEQLEKQVDELIATVANLSATIISIQDFYYYQEND